MDYFIYKLVNGTCYVIDLVGLTRLEFDMCFTRDGRTFLYYGIVALLVMVVLAFISAMLEGGDNDGSRDK